MVSTQDPPEIRHNRWRHKKRGYTVKVLGVYNHGRHPPYHRTVLVDRMATTKKPRSWSAHRFVAEFEPIGRPPKKKTLWDFLVDLDI